MASPKVKLTFTDGHVEEATLNPRIMVEVERKFGTIPPIEGTLFGAWLRLGRKGDFESFLDSIDDMSEETVSAPVPTVPAVSEGS